jgi:acylphosphatase
MENTPAPDRDLEHWLVTGRVQGVGYRWFVVQAARRRGLRGDVRNLPDGRVEVRAAGPAQRLASLRDDLGEGPPGARVDAVDSLEPDPGLRFDGFDVRL